MDSVKSRQTEGYDFYDYAEVVFNATGGAEVTYTVGTQANAAILGSWPSQSTLPVPIPFDAQHTVVLSDVECFIRLINSTLLGQQALAILPAGFPVQIRIRANVETTLRNKWVQMRIVGSGLAGGTIRIRSSG